MTYMGHNRTRTLGLQVIALLLIVSFVCIPVRCDASAAPHSIFMSATMVNEQHAGTHHHAATDAASTDAAPTHEKHVPGHDPRMAMATTHHAASAQTQVPQPSSDLAPVALQNSLHNPCGVSLASGNDPKSQQPVGATLDLPTTTIAPDSTTLHPLDTTALELMFAPAVELSGFIAPPEAPPPKAS